MNIKLYPLSVQESSFLKVIAYYAIFLPKGQDPYPKEIIQEPSLKKYWEAWGKDTDSGLIAILESSHVKTGAVWMRLFSEENPQLIQRWFRLSDAPEKTFIAGSSMGGYGAVKLALENPTLFAAAASLSGALDVASHIHDEWDESRQRAFGAVFDSLDKVPGSAFDLIAQAEGLQKIPQLSDFEQIWQIGSRYKFSK